MQLSVARLLLVVLASTSTVLMSACSDDSADSGQGQPAAAESDSSGDAQDDMSDDNPLAPVIDEWSEDAKVELCQMFDQEGERIATMFLSNGSKIPAFTTEDLREVIAREC